MSHQPAPESPKTAAATLLAANLSALDAVKIAAVVDAARHSNFVLDAQTLENVDTSTLVLLLEVARCAKSHQQQFELRHVPEKLIQLAQIHGVWELLEPSCVYGASTAIGANTLGDQKTHDKKQAAH